MMFCNCNLCQTSCAEKQCITMLSGFHYRANVTPGVLRATLLCDVVVGIQTTSKGNPKEDSRLHQDNRQPNKLRCTVYHPMTSEQQQKQFTHGGLPKIIHDLISRSAEAIMVPSRCSMCDNSCVVVAERTDLSLSDQGPYTNCDRTERYLLTLDGKRI